MFFLNFKFPRQKVWLTQNIVSSHFQQDETAWFLTRGCLPPVSASIFTWASPLVSVLTLPLFPLIRIKSLHLRPTINPGWSHLEILNSFALAKILFPNKVTLAGAGVRHLRFAFGGGIIQSTTARKSILAHEGLVFLSVVHSSPISEPAGPFPRHTGSQKHFTPSETTVWGWGPGICLLKVLPKWFLPSVREPPYQAPENWNSSIYYRVNLPAKQLAWRDYATLGHGVVVHAGFAF